MNRGKIIKALMENEELSYEDLAEISRYEGYSLKPDSFVRCLSKFHSVDFRLGSAVSECFSEGELLSEEFQSEWCLARVISDAYVIPFKDEITFYSSVFTLDPDNQSKHPIENIELNGSELTTIIPPPTTELIIKDYSKVNLNLTKKSRGGMHLYRISVGGNNSEVVMNAEVEDRVREGEFVLRVTGGSNNKVELDLRNLKLKLFKLYFHRSGINNYIHVKLNKNTDVKSMYLDCETEGVKIIIEGGKDIDVYDLVDNKVDYEVI
jgi:hypothetical protein